MNRAPQVVPLVGLLNDEGRAVVAVRSLSIGVELCPSIGVQD
jgi:hypothetical protein